MLATSRVLATLIERYFRSASSGDRDCRILVPGLTYRISRELHGYLLQQNINSYLVVGEEDQPNEAARLIRAVGLTSKRIGSFVAVASPGQLIQIQDSIRGSGGAIRSLAFSEEWPWIDDGSEPFRFDGPVLEALVSEWSADVAEREWLRDFILNGLLEYSRPSSRRAQVLLEAILGTFNPNEYPEIDGVKQKFLYHAGIPRPSGAVPNVSRLIKDSARLSQRIIERCQKDEDVRDQAREMILETIPENERNEVRLSLDRFLDRLGKSTTLDLGLLSFHGCWGGDPSDTSDWRRLDAERLANLFSVRERERAEVTYSVSCQRGLVAGDGRKLATFVGEQVELDISFRIPTDHFAEGPWAIGVFNRQRKIVDSELHENEGNLRLQFGSDSIGGRYTRKVPIRIALVSGGDIRADARLDINLCGQDRPAFAVIEPGFEVADAFAASGEETPDKKVVVDDPVHVFLFSSNETDVALVKNDDEELSLIETGMNGIWRSAQRLDVTSEPSGQMTILCRFGDLSSVFSLEAGDLEKGEFTIEDELRVLLAGPREKRLGDLFGLFEGTNRNPYPALGGLDNTAILRKDLARILSTRTGWRPLLANLLKVERRVSGSVGDFINCLGPVDGEAFAALSLPADALALLRAYSDARDAILREIESRLDTDGARSEHPIYASHPIFVQERSEQMEAFLYSYLMTYRRILSYIQTAKRNLEWGQLFVLTHLDCVVHWDSTRLRNAFFLVGPWHPLVMAKRFMVQAALYGRAHRFLHADDGKSFRHLSVLLGRVQGFRWLVGLSADDRQVEPAFVAMTSDPGWHLALKTNCAALATQEGVGGLTGILATIWQNFGLHVDMGSGVSGDLSVTGLSNYVRAFPSRRSVSLRIRRGYSVGEVIRNVDAFLHGEDGPTSLGKQLPGGVRLYVEEGLGNEVSAQWSDPPLCVCRFDNDEECIGNAHPDIYMLPPPSEVTFKPDTENHNMPRGVGRQAVFGQPLKWLTEGQTLVPKSISAEFDPHCDMGGGVGGSFASAIGQVREVLGTAVTTVSSVDLPQRLAAPWVIIPGQSIDPAILVKYVRDGADRALQERALWDYKLDLAGRANSFFILSTIPRGFMVAVNGFFGGGDTAGEFIVELGKIGIAIGGEALKTGRHALGIIGLVGAVRMLVRPGRDGRAPLQSGQGILSFLVPVDSFASFFGKSDSSDGRRTDLLAVSLLLPRGDSGKLLISACGVESKFVSGTLGIPRAHAALAQGQATIGEFKNLVVASLRDGSMPERLALLELLQFGLRITSPSRPADIEQWVDMERLVYAAILSGDYEYVDARYGAVLVSTEGDLPGVAEHVVLPEGLWLRLTRNHWPGVAETPQLQAAREALCVVFDTLGHAQMSPPSAPTPPISEIGEGTPAPSGDLVPQEEPGTQTAPVSPLEGGVESPAEAEPIEEGLGRPLEKIFIGVDDSRSMVYFDPQSPVDPLDNLNIMVTGSSGKGKTQLLKYLVCKLREQGKNLLVLDFKNDFASDEPFTRRADLERIFVAFGGLPYNPLIPYPVRHPVTGEMYLQPGQHIAGVTSVLKRTVQLGAQQAVNLKNAMASAFEAAGIPSTGTVRYLDISRLPDFGVVGNTLRDVDDRAFNRLEPLFGLFNPEFRTVSFHELTSRSMVIDLSQIPSEEIKNALSQLVVMSAHRYFNSLPHSGSIRQLFVIDEANRVLDYDYMAEFVLQCRAYGVGVILSSQYPSQFHPDVSSSMATKILHGNERDNARVRAIVQLIRCEGREGDVANLDRFQAFVDNRHYPHTLLRTFSYPQYLVWARLEQQGVATREELAHEEGIDTTKLPIGNLIHQLELLGLAEELEGQVHAIWPGQSRIE